MYCDGAYNNADDLASHFSNAHSVKNIKYKHCYYSATSAARMRIHVWKHTKGEWCKHCSHTYLTLHSLQEHEKLHGARTEYQCETCSKVFVTVHSLRVHCKGKHRDGYSCSCGQVFELPAQHLHHSKKYNK